MAKRGVETAPVRGAKSKRPAEAKLAELKGRLVEISDLESAGLIARHVTQSKAIAVEYSLTELGRTIIAPLRGMCRWAKRYLREVSADVHFPERYEAR